MDNGRLTERDALGAFTLTGFDSTRGTGPVVDKLAAYEDAEEQGRLVLLPCKIGERVYEIYPIGKYPLHACSFLCAGTVDGKKVMEPCAYFTGGEDCAAFDIMSEWNIRAPFFRFEHLKDVGKTIFLTRAEAEAALQARNAAQ